MKKTASKKKRYRISVLYHDVAKNSLETHGSQTNTIDADTSKILQFFIKTLKKHHFVVEVIPLQKRDLTPLSKLRTDYIFNLVDSKEMEIKIAKILDRIHIPYSGTPWRGLQISNNKIRSKRAFTKSHLPTPAYTVIPFKTRITRSLVPSKFPVMLKPAFEHGSVGISVHSVVSNYEKFKKQVMLLRKEFRQAILAEQFIPGRDIQVTVMEKDETAVALPISEMVTQGMRNNKWNIYGFEEKWDEDNNVYSHLHFISPPLHIPKKIADEVQRDTIRAFYALGYHDYARFDLRYNRQTKEWFFLEGNSNPGICEARDDAMTAAIHAAGMNLEEFILSIIDNGLHFK
jgi:D-alanine-D-alanine ligase